MSSSAETQTLEWLCTSEGLLGGAGEVGWFSDVGLWRKAILWMTGCYLILNLGFMYVRIPPVGAGVPAGELFLVLSLLALNLTIVIPRMSREVWMFPILLWWAYSLSRVLLGVRVGGAWAFRDGSQEIESLYLIIGFWLVNQPIYLRYFFRWLRRVLVALGFYALLVPVSGTLTKFSPALPGMNASVRSLFFQVVGTPSLALWVGAWLLMRRPGENTPQLRARYIFAGILLIESLVFTQIRTVYNQVAILTLLFLGFYRKIAYRWVMVLIIGLALFAAVSTSGLSIKGRRHQVSVGFMVHLFESSAGKEAGEGTEGAAGGVTRRLEWWRHIAFEMEASDRNMAFGLGFGIPLTNFMPAAGVLVREPHDSYISVCARLGVLGFFLWTLMQILLLWSWWKSFRLARTLNWIQDQQNLLLLLIYWVLILTFALGEDALEKPFLAIPYYLFAGVMLRYGTHLREAAASYATDTEWAEPQA